MTDFTATPKEKINEVLAEFNQHTARIDKLKKRIEGLRTELSKLNQDEHFDEYHSKNQEVNYYEKQLAIAVDSYETQRLANRLEIEGNLYSPIIRGLHATRKKVNYEVEKDKIIQEFTKKMNALQKKHNEKILEYMEGISPELEQLKEHFADTDFKHINLMQATTAHYHFKLPLKEYLEENQQ